MAMFAPNCSLPPSGPIFVSSPNVRGTLDILWGCLSVLVICTWSILHLNVPIQSTPRNTRQKYQRAIIRTLHKAKWMLINFAAPEWAFGKAWSDYRSASVLEERFKKVAEDDNVTWSRTHTHFANMGGFGVKFDDSTCAAVLEVSPTEIEATEAESELKEIRDLFTLAIESSSVDKWQELWQRQAQRIGDIPWKLDETNEKSIAAVIAKILAPGFLSLLLDSEQQKILVFPSQWVHNLLALRGSLWILDANQLLFARNLGIIDRLPDVAHDDLEDRNKANLFVKIVLLGQIMWFIVQICSRAVKHIPASQMEIVTLAFAVSCGTTYLLLLDKPKNAQFSIILPAKKRPALDHFARIASAGPVSGLGRHRGRVSIPNGVLHVDRSIDKVHFEPFLMLYMAAAANLVVFGSLQILAFNTEFPTHTEKVLWHISTISTITALPVWFLVSLARIPLAYIFRGKVKNLALYFKAWDVIIFTFFTAAFFAARLFIIVEMFRSLAFLPPEAFITTWAQNIPHIG